VVITDISTHRIPRKRAVLRTTAETTVAVIYQQRAVTGVWAENVAVMICQSPNTRIHIMSFDIIIILYTVDANHRLA